MNDYVTIFGEKIRGTIYVERTNVFIVKDEKGGMNVVLKPKTIKKKSSKSKKRVNKEGFDAERVKQIGYRTEPIKFKTPSRNTRYSMV